MLHPDARISATMQVKIQSHPGERWTVSCCALNKRDGRSLTLNLPQLIEIIAVTRFMALCLERTKIVISLRNSVHLSLCLEKSRLHSSSKLVGGKNLPPARVAMAWKMLKLINSLMNRTLPSANRKLAPPG